MPKATDNQIFSINTSSNLPLPTLVGSATGFQINLVWDSTVRNAPLGFQTAIIQAAKVLCNSISSNISLNLGISCTGADGIASGGPTTGTYVPYTTVRDYLLSNAPAGANIFNALPNGSTIQGESIVTLWDAQLKLWGFKTSDELDGSASFAPDIPINILTSVALHELTHCLGRIHSGSPPAVFDLFRYQSPGSLLFSGDTPSLPAYFSIDGGKTHLADYGINSDPSDFLNTDVQGKNDPFNEFYSANTQQPLSVVDLIQLEAIGYKLTPATQAKIIVNVANFITNKQSGNTESFFLLDTSTNISSKIDTLQSYVNKLISITLSEVNTPLVITSTQSITDHDVLAKISTAFNLLITGTSAADRLYDTIKSHATLTGNKGIDTFNVTGIDTITDLGNGGADILKVAVGGVANATIKSPWTATINTINNGKVNISTAGLAVNLSAVTKGTSGYKITDTGEATQLIGSALSDIIIGASKNDTLSGGLGNDTITGGKGNDLFVFNTKLNSVSNIDLITDFTPGKDHLQISKAIFAGINTKAVTGIGAALKVAEFISSPDATHGITANSHLIYNSTSGALYYDADGNGKGAAVEVTVLGTATHPALAATDILIIT